MDCVISHIISPGVFFAQIGNVKQFDDFEKLVKIIQQYCMQRLNHFHSVSNVSAGEVVFFKSTLRDGEFVRGRVLTSTIERCSLSLIDYGPKELEVNSVLKIDPSVQRFSTINPFARQFSLAFVKPVEGKWCPEATELFKQHCQGRLIYLPTEDPDYITIVTRTLNPPQGVTDVSVLLIQAGYARRVSSAGEEDSLPPSIAASVSDATQQLHSVGIQTEVDETNHTVDLPAPVEFSNSGGDVGDGSGDCVKAMLPQRTSNYKPRKIYVPPALRCEAKADACRYQQFRLNHDSFCSCLTCTIRTTLEDFQLTNKERLTAVLSTAWLKLTKKEETILHGAITGTSLNSEERGLLLDILLGLTRQQVIAEEMKEKPRKRSIDSSTQVTSSSNRLTLSSYAVDVDDDARSTATSEDITIMRKSSGGTRANKQHAADLSTSVGENWSDLDNQSINSTDSEPDVIATSDSSTVETVVTNRSDLSNAAANTLPGSPHVRSFGSDGSPVVGRRLFTSASPPPQGLVASSTRNSSLDAGSPEYSQGTTLLSLGCTQGATPSGPGYTQGNACSYRGYRQEATPPSPGYTQDTAPPNLGYMQGTTPPSPGYTQGTTPPNPGYRQGATPASTRYTQGTTPPNLGYTQGATPPSPGHPKKGQGLPTACRSTSPSRVTNYAPCPPMNNSSRESVSAESHGSSTACSDDMNSIVGNFGMIMYCSFCGGTQHRSSNCPTGTKNLFN